MLSDVPSAPRFLVDVFSFVVHAEFEVGILQRIFISQTTDFHFANYRFSFRKLQIFISQTTDFHFVSFHFVSLHFVSQTTVSLKTLVIVGKVYVAWKRKMLHDVIGGHQAYIQRNQDLFIYELSNFAAG